MNLKALALLNRCIAGRIPVAAVTALEEELAPGERVIVLTLEEVGKQPYAEALLEAFRTGKSGLIEAGGKRFFLNVHVPPVKLVIIGAVHISQSLAQMAALVDIDCVIIDPRTAFATPERFPGAFSAKVEAGFAPENATRQKTGTQLIAEWPDVALPGLAVDRFTAFVALTHDPKIDDPALHHALERGCFYIGALGSRKTHGKRLERLSALGHGEAALARIHAPIGLDIGAVSPAEIALAILGEIIAAMRARRRG